MGTIELSGFWRIGQTLQNKDTNPNCTQYYLTVIAFSNQDDASLAEGEQDSLWILNKASFNLI